MTDYSHLRVAERRAEYGSFKDSLRAPVHRWFMYPAGFSYRLVESKIEEYGLDENCTVLDPFVGCGTTSVVAKQKAVNSVGIDAHPFVFWVAKTKLFWEYNLGELSRAIEEVSLQATSAEMDCLAKRLEDGEFPPLVTKCFTTENLVKLLAIRETIVSAKVSAEVRDFLKLALASTLRIVSWAGTGWPYIAPSKYHGKTTQRDAFTEFHSQATRMYQDIIAVTSSASGNDTSHVLILGDARATHSELHQETVDLVITSPPYLNNYDYADRTRLELYFFGLASSWRDITDQVRAKLMMAATTQVTRAKCNDRSPLSAELKATAPRVFAELEDKVHQLADVRLRKGGKKSYDIMVAGYFNDMLQVLKQVHTVLKPGGDLVLVLGDSAPYGVYVPTDFLIGELALAVGFKTYQVEMLRPRGGKWFANPQRHKVGLRESIVTIAR
ncbi:MAG: DNA methyltransferase [Dehalococcoidia bacterium]